MKMVSKIALVAVVAGVAVAGSDAETMARGKKAASCARGLLALDLQGRRLHRECLLDAALRLERHLVSVDRLVLEALVPGLIGEADLSYGEGCAVVAEPFFFCRI